MLRLAMTPSLLAALPKISLRESNGLDLKSLIKAPSAVIPTSDSTNIKQVKLIRDWNGPLCSSRLINQGKDPVRIKEVVLFDLSLSLPETSSLYAEGFQMLSQTGGTLGQPIDLGNYTDQKHYKMPTPTGARCLYGLLSLAPSAGENYLLAFTSCRRFIGQFYLRGTGLQIVVDTEGLELNPELHGSSKNSCSHPGQTDLNCLSSCRDG
jgi:alpha-galactosidase